MIKIAFISKPRLSGDYTHFKYLRDNLIQYKFFLVGLGNHGQLDEEDKDFIHLGSLLDRKKDQKALAKLFMEFYEKESIDIVIPVDSSIVVSCIPFFKNIRIVHIVNLDSLRLYKYVTSHLSIVSKIICISTRQLEVLKYRLNESIFFEKVVLIPHGVKPVQNVNLNIHFNFLRIGFIGRMHHGHKGILWIPKILKKINVPFEFELVGEGRDHQKFLDQLKENQIIFTNHGYVSPDHIDMYLHKWDILLFPSQIEGFGLTLIEAMNNGVVPIANNLPGITDYIIDNEKNGFLVRKNRISEFVDRIHQLNGDRDLLNKMKISAVLKVRSCFNLSKILIQYEQIFEDVINGDINNEVKNFANWEPFVEYTPSLPTKLMNRLRMLRDNIINHL